MQLVFCDHSLMWRLLLYSEVLNNVCSNQFGVSWRLETRITLEIMAGFKKQQLSASIRFSFELSALCWLHKERLEPFHTDKQH